MNLLYIFDLIGTAAFAVSGALAGVQRQMDLLGILVLGIVTAIGGGTLRDILLGDTPPFCLKDENYLYVSIAAALITFFAHNMFHRYRNALLYFDAIGLGTFVVIGTGKALAFGTGFIGAITMGMMTATAGGMLRDILSGQIPLILQKEIYASACLAGAILFYMLSKFNVERTTIMFLSALVVISLRLLAIKHNWALPTAKPPR
ncbi:MAG: trimeric intracellular cation channel family protein [Desulfuromonas sp.]|nr:trimeric intracellular cation channel family protein [Desulfuromonas sp.]